MKRLLFVLPILGFALLAGFFAYGLTQDPSKLPSTLIDRPLPAFELAGLDANTPGLKAAQLRGEPALLNVFASWCIACKVEHPVLLRLSSEGVPLYGLAWKDKPSDSAGYLAGAGNPFRRVGSDPDGRAGIDLGVAAVPETFLVDKHGRVRFKQVGPIMPEDWENTIKPLMARLRAEA